MTFIDAENISKNLFLAFYKNHPDEKYLVYGKKEIISAVYLKAKNVEFINCCVGKNSADTFMVADIVKSLYEDNVSHYYLLSQDRDLAVAVREISKHSKLITIVTGLGNRLSNLKQIGADLSYVDVQELDCGSILNLGIGFKKVKKNSSNTCIFNQCTDNIWLKTRDRKILEVPFKNGLPLTSFKKLVSAHQKTLAVGSAQSWGEFLDNNFLNLRDKKVYYKSEEELWIGEKEEV